MVDLTNGPGNTESSHNEGAKGHGEQKEQNKPDQAGKGSATISPTMVPTEREENGQVKKLSLLNQFGREERENGAENEQATCQEEKGRNLHLAPP